MKPQENPTPFPDEIRLPLTFSFPADASPMRLDAALGLALPDLGLRARRRLWDWCGILVNNRPQAAGCLVHPGDTITLRVPLKTEELCFSGKENELFCEKSVLLPYSTGAKNSFDAAGKQKNRFLAKARPAILGAGAGFTLISKPWGMHSAHIAGTATSSVEGMLPDLWRAYLPGGHEEHASTATAPQQGTPQPAYSFSPASAAPHHAEAPSAALPRLLTRLDYDTSGLLVAANSPEAETLFRQWEAEGRLRKTYFALVAGRCEQPLYIDAALNVANRATTAVLDAVEPDAARHTGVIPVAHWQIADTLAYSLVRVDIRRGARHQIRAHLAHAGFPLVGDARYGVHGTLHAAFLLLFQAEHLPGTPLLPLPGYLLHHTRIATPVFTASLTPTWQGLEGLLPKDNSPPAPHTGKEGCRKSKGNI